MPTLIVADVHSNLEALQAVLEDARRRAFIEAIWNLGDTVGYGPDPRECIALLRELGALSVAGNHDRAATGRLSTAHFNPSAAAAARWTKHQLTPDDAAYLDSLPEVLTIEPFTLVHGSPRYPLEEYLLSASSAAASFSDFSTSACLVGHSHVPMAFRSLDGRCVTLELPEGEPLVLGERRLIINPGGVGQPRDGDPRAAYAVYDEASRMVTAYRIEYDIEATQRKMLQAGLPPNLAERLSYGL